MTILDFLKDDHISIFSGFFNVRFKVFLLSYRFIEEMKIQCSHNALSYLRKSSGQGALSLIPETGFQKESSKCMRQMLRYILTLIPESSSDI